MREKVVRVDKPWGHELRFVRTDRFAGKVLVLKAGHQLSLQYHEHKDEAFLVQDGTLELVVAEHGTQRVERLGPNEAWRVLPGTIHRFRAVTDCVVFEVSTPELEDVVRLEDDYGRQGTTDRPV